MIQCLNIEEVLISEQQKMSVDYGNKTALNNYDGLGVSPGFFIRCVNGCIILNR